MDIPHQMSCKSSFKDPLSLAIKSPGGCLRVLAQCLCDVTLSKHNACPTHCRHKHCDMHAHDSLGSGHIPRHHLGWMRCGGNCRFLLPQRDCNTPQDRTVCAQIHTGCGCAGRENPTPLFAAHTGLKPPHNSAAGIRTAAGQTLHAEIDSDATSSVAIIQHWAAQCFTRLW